MKYINCIIIAAITLIVGSCTKLDEEPVGLLAPESYFKNASDAEAAVMGVYSMMNRNLFYGRRLPMTLQLLGDLVDIGDIGTRSTRIQTNNFMGDASNDDYSSIWSTAYLIIGAANGAIDGLPNVDMDETKKNQLLAEARMARALAYYHLTMLFGDIPYIGEFVRDPSSVGDVTRTPSNEIFNIIIEDLQFGINSLPDSYSNNVRSRPTKGTAHTFLAKVYLVQEKWSEAAEQAEIVINNAGQFGYGLMDDYKDLWNADLGELDEHIWTVDFLGGTSGSNGSNVDYTAPMTGVRNADMQGWSVLVPSPGVYDFFPDNDYRKDVIFLTETPVNGVMTPYTEWTWPRIHFTKWCLYPGQNANADGSSSDHNYVIFRYAEVLLMAAEALNEANGPSDKAYEYLNAIRARARNNGNTISDSPADIARGLTKEEFRKAIRDERIYELAFEWKRWYDLKRWRIVEDVFKGPNSFELHENVKPYHYFLPIPQDELGRNPNLLPQNQGY